MWSSNDSMQTLSVSAVVSLDQWKLPWVREALRSVLRHVRDQKSKDEGLELDQDKLRRSNQAKWKNKQAGGNKPLWGGAERRMKEKRGREKQPRRTDEALKRSLKRASIIQQLWIMGQQAGRGGGADQRGKREENVLRWFPWEIQSEKVRRSEEATRRSSRVRVFRLGCRIGFSRTGCDTVVTWNMGIYLHQVHLCLWFVPRDLNAAWRENAAASFTSMFARFEGVQTFFHMRANT